jgi:hypothetical protein
VQEQPDINQTENPSETEENQHETFHTNLIFELLSLLLKTLKLRVATDEIS